MPYDDLRFYHVSTMGRRKEGVYVLYVVSLMPVYNTIYEHGHGVWVVSLCCRGVLFQFLVTICLLPQPKGIDCIVLYR